MRTWETSEFSAGMNDRDAFHGRGDNENLQFLPPTALPLPQQAEVRAVEDDWTGLTDPARRRKLQNRLHQRAWRRRKANERRKNGDKLAASRTDSDPYLHISGVEKRKDTVTDTQSLEAHSQGSELSFEDASLINVSGPMARLEPSMICRMTPADVRKIMARFEQSAFLEYEMGSPRLDHLLTLIQFNVFRALISNTKALGFTLDWLNEEAVSPFNTSLPTPPLSSKTSSSLVITSCPPNLLPTALQRTTPHHPWLDLFPIPTMRDNIFRLGEDYDDAPLCYDLIEFCHAPGERSGLIVWGDPWDPSNWEVTEEFLRKWAWVIRGCRELFASTNYWRGKRGEKKLFPD